ncbi:hypothetical protein SASPL_113115 [Salvia splendens]|uniref:Dehydrin n=1 Tax=Salvia splendens TaxID=180675 RepID=A0A8X8Y320_SALSN|nr:hypothetical protein SASPL_113115 [Salvia splendens]
MSHLAIADCSISWGRKRMRRSPANLIRKLRFQRKIRRSIKPSERCFSDQTAPPAGSSSCDDKKPTQEGEEKKGLLDKITEKLPGGKKAEEVATPPPTPVAEEKEKKGFLDKIKDKIPGYSKTDEEKENEKENEAVCN